MVTTLWKQSTRVGVQGAKFLFSVLWLGGGESIDLTVTRVVGTCNTQETKATGSFEPSSMLAWGTWKKPMLQERQEMGAGRGGEVVYNRNVIIREMQLEIGNCQKNQLRYLRVVVSEWRERECAGGGGFHFSVSLKERSSLKYANCKLVKVKTE